MAPAQKVAEGVIQMRNFVLTATFSFVVPLLEGCSPQEPLPAASTFEPIDPFVDSEAFNTVDPARAFSVIARPNAVLLPLDMDNSKPLFALAYEFRDELQIVATNASGTWGELVRVPVGNGPRDIVTLNLNGSGNFDIVTADTGSSTLTLVAYDQAAGFHAAGTIPLTMAPRHLAVADINGDGQEDLITSVGLDTEGGISVWTPEAGSLTPLINFFPLPRAARIALGDLDGDLDPDLVIVYSSGLAIVRNDDGNLSLVATLSPCDTPWAADVADFNGNGLGDVVVACHGNAWLLFDPIHGANQIRSLGPTGQLYDIVAANLDGHGTLDIAAVDVTKHQMPLWFAPAENGNIAPLGHGTHRGPVALRAIDVDVDGDLDMVVLAYEQRSLNIFVNNSKE